MVTDLIKTLKMVHIQKSFFFFLKNRTGPFPLSNFRDTVEVMNVTNS